MKIFAIDPGNEESGYLYADCKGNKIKKIIRAGKENNYQILVELYEALMCNEEPQIVIEMVESFGMPVGRTVFDTCIWIGRFVQYANDCLTHDAWVEYVTRKEEKLNLCKSMKAKDSNIRQALIDKYAKTDNGKGTKQNPDFFYGFKADMWSACAVADTYLEREYGRI